MSERTTYAWAVAYPPTFGPSVDIHSVSGTRRFAMERFVADRRHSGHDGLTVSKVWQHAYSRGWRLVRVAITPLYFGKEPS